MWWISARQRGCHVCAERLGAGVALPLSIYHNYLNYHKPCAQPWPHCHLCLVTPLLQGRACKAESCWQLLTPAARLAFLPLLLLKDLAHPKMRALCGRWNLKLGGMWLGLYTAEKHSGDAGRELPAVPPRSCSSLSPSTFVFASQGPLCCHSASVGTLCQNQTSEGQQSWPFVFLPPV